MSKRKAESSKIPNRTIITDSKSLNYAEINSFGSFFYEILRCLSLSIIKDFTRKYDTFVIPIASNDNAVDDFNNRLVDIIETELSSLRVQTYSQPKIKFSFMLEKSWIAVLEVLFNICSLDSGFTLHTFLHIMKKLFAVIGMSPEDNIEIIHNLLIKNEEMTKSVRSIIKGKGGIRGVNMTGAARVQSPEWTSSFGNWTSEGTELAIYQDWNSLQILFNIVIDASPLNVIVPALYNSLIPYLMNAKYFSSGIEVLKLRCSCLFFHPIMVDFWSTLISLRGSSEVNHAFTTIHANFEGSSMFSDLYTTFMKMMRLDGMHTSSKQEYNPLHIHKEVYDAIPMQYRNYFTSHNSNTNPHVGLRYTIPIIRQSAPRFNPAPIAKFTKRY